MSMQPYHPDWCRESDCGATALHRSPLRRVAPRGDEVIQVRAGLWRMDVGPTRVDGVLLEFSVGEQVECWPIDLAQSRALVGVLRDLLPLAEGAQAAQSSMSRSECVTALYLPQLGVHRIS